MKQSVREFEGFDTRFQDLETDSAQTSEVSMERLKQKLFVDEFFDPKAKDILPKNGITTYEIKNHPYNEKFLQALFTKGETVLPIQNIGEMAYII